jgi:hypothetical protein
MNFATDLNMPPDDDASFLKRCRRGDQAYFYFLASNNDLENSAEVTVTTAIGQVAGLPDGFSEEDSTGNFDANVFAIADPAGDTFNHSFVDDPATWPLLPEGDPRTNPSGLTRTLTLQAGESRFVVVSVRSFGMCANGSCNKLSVKLEGAFADGSPALACASAALLIDEAPEKSRRYEFRDDIKTADDAITCYSPAVFLDANFNTLPHTTTHAFGNIRPDQGAGTWLYGTNIQPTGAFNSATDYVRVDETTPIGGVGFTVSQSGPQGFTENIVAISGLPEEVGASMSVPVIIIPGTPQMQVIIDSKKDSIRIKTPDGQFLLYAAVYSEFIESPPSGVSIDPNSCRIFTKTAGLNVPEICTNVYSLVPKPGDQQSVSVFDQNGSPLSGTVEIVGDNTEFVSLESTTFSGEIRFITDDPVLKDVVANVKIQVPGALPQEHPVPVFVGQGAAMMLNMNYSFDIVSNPFIGSSSTMGLDFKNTITPGEGQTFSDTEILTWINFAGITYTLPDPNNTFTLTPINSQTDPAVLQQVADDFGSDAVEDCKSDSASCALIGLGDVGPDGIDFVVNADGFLSEDIPAGVNRLSSAAKGSNTTKAEASQNFAVLDDNGRVPITSGEDLSKAIDLANDTDDALLERALIFFITRDVSIFQSSKKIKGPPVFIQGDPFPEEAPAPTGASKAGSAAAVTIDGSNCPAPCNGLILAGGNSGIENIRFANFPDFGVVLEADSNRVINSEFVGNGQGGLRIANSSDNVIGGTLAEGNRFTANGGPGLLIESGMGNAVLFNTFADNAGLGIDLGGDGVTANDPGDGDSGPNNLQNFPELSNAQTVPEGGTRIEGSLNSAANASFTLQFFASDACDASGNGEGARFVGSTVVTTDANGDASFLVTTDSTAAIGQFVTATATDSEGNTSEFSTCFEITTVVAVGEPGESLPTEFALHENYPNPFNPGTTISYALPKAANVRLAIFNLRGQLVRTLVDEELPAGLHKVQWDGRSDAGAPLASGVYVYRMQAGSFVQTRKMILMK